MSLLPGNGHGFRVCSFACDWSDAEYCLSVLQRHKCIDPAAAYFHGAKLHFRIDLAELPEGDGPAAELRVLRALEKACSRHRKPSEPPPPSEAA